MSQEYTNAEFLDALNNSSPETFTKMATEGGGRTIRLRLREKGIQRAKILPFDPLGERAQRLIPHSTDDDLPYLIEEMEAAQAGAITVAYNGTTQLSRMSADRFEVRFHRNITPKFWKHAREFATWKTDLKALTINNALLDLETQEDANWFRAHNSIVGALNTAGADGRFRHRGSVGGVTRANWLGATEYFNAFKLRPGVYITNWTTLGLLGALDHDAWGGPGAEKNFKEGLKDVNPFGVPHAVTIKSELIPNRVIQMYAPTDFLGVAYEMNPTQCYVKKEDDIVSTYADETVGFAIANPNALGKWTFGA